MRQARVRVRAIEAKRELGSVEAFPPTLVTKNLLSISITFHSTPLNSKVNEWLWHFFCFVLRSWGLQSMGDEGHELGAGVWSSIDEHLFTLGLVSVDVAADGNCQFRALAHMLLRDGRRHDEVRACVVKVLRAGAAVFCDHVCEQDLVGLPPQAAGPAAAVPLWDRFLAHIECAGTWGNYVTLLAAAYGFRSTIYVVPRTGMPLMVLSPPAPVGEVHLAFSPEWHFRATMPLVARVPDPRADNIRNVRRAPKTSVNGPLGNPTDAASSRGPGAATGAGAAAAAAAATTDTAVAGNALCLADSDSNAYIDLSNSNACIDLCNSDADETALPSPNAPGMAVLLRVAAPVAAGSSRSRDGTAGRQHGMPSAAVAAAGRLRAQGAVTDQRSPVSRLKSFEKALGAAAVEAVQRRATACGQVPVVLGEGGTSQARWVMADPTAYLEGESLLFTPLVSKQVRAFQEVQRRRLEGVWLPVKWEGSSGVPGRGSGPVPGGSTRSVPGALLPVGAHELMQQLPLINMLLGHAMRTVVEPGSGAKLRARLTRVRNTVNSAAIIITQLVTAGELRPEDAVSNLLHDMVRVARKVASVTAVSAYTISIYNHMYGKGGKPDVQYRSNGTAEDWLRCAKVMICMLDVACANALNAADQEKTMTHAPPLGEAQSAEAALDRAAARCKSAATCTKGSRARAAATANLAAGKYRGLRWYLHCIDELELLLAGTTTVYRAARDDPLGSSAHGAAVELVERFPGVRSYFFSGETGGGSATRATVVHLLRGARELRQVVLPVVALYQSNSRPSTLIWVNVGDVGATLGAVGGSGGGSGGGGGGDGGSCSNVVWSATQNRHRCKTVKGAEQEHPCGTQLARALLDETADFVDGGGRQDAPLFTGRRSLNVSRLRLTTDELAVNHKFVIGSLLGLIGAPGMQDLRSELCVVLMVSLALGLPWGLDGGRHPSYPLRVLEEAMAALMRSMESDDPQKRVYNPFPIHRVGQWVEPFPGARPRLDEDNGLRERAVQGDNFMALALGGNSGRTRAPSTREEAHAVALAHERHMLQQAGMLQLATEKRQLPTKLQAELGGMTQAVPVSVKACAAGNHGHVCYCGGTVDPALDNWTVVCPVEQGPGRVKRHETWHAPCWELARAVAGSAPAAASLAGQSSVQALAAGAPLLLVHVCGTIRKEQLAAAVLLVQGLLAAPSVHAFAAAQAVLRANAGNCVDVAGGVLPAPPAPPRRPSAVVANATSLTIVGKMRKCKDCEAKLLKGTLIAETNGPPPHGHQQWGTQWHGRCWPCIGLYLGSGQLGDITVVWGSSESMGKRLAHFPHLLALVRGAVTAGNVMCWDSVSAAAYCAAHPASKQPAERSTQGSGRTPRVKGGKRVGREDVFGQQRHAGASRPRNEGKWGDDELAGLSAAAAASGTKVGRSYLAFIPTRNLRQIVSKVQCLARLKVGAAQETLALCGGGRVTLRDGDNSEDDTARSHGGGGAGTFSSQEKDNLKAGVAMFGCGQWLKILHHFKFASGRTNVNLKDKWRQMVTLNEKMKGQKRTEQLQCSNDGGGHEPGRSDSGRCKPGSLVDTARGQGHESPARAPAAREAGAQPLLAGYSTVPRPCRKLLCKKEPCSSAKRLVFSGNPPPRPVSSGREQMDNASIARARLQNWPLPCKPVADKVGTAGTAGSNEDVSITDDHQEDDADDTGLRSDSSSSRKRDSTSAFGQACGGGAPFEKSSTKRVKWTAVEVQALLDGVKEHGAGKWRRILDCGGFHRCRTTISLKDKWKQFK